MDPEKQIQEKQVFELAVIRETLPAAAEETATYSVFPFVMVRSPRLALAPAAGRDVAYQDRSELAGRLEEIRTLRADEAVKQREEMQKLAAESAAKQADDRQKLLPQASELARLGQWLRQVPEGVSAEALEARPAAKPLEDDQLRLVWDILFQQALIGAQAVPFPEPVAVLKAQHFLRVAEKEGMTPEVAQRQARAELFLPTSIFPLTPLLAPEPPAVEPVPDLDAQYKRLADLHTTYAGIAAATRVARRNRTRYAAAAHPVPGEGRLR